MATNRISQIGSLLQHMNYMSEKKQGRITREMKDSWIAKLHDFGIAVTMDELDDFITNG